MTWERMFFRHAAVVLNCRQANENGHPDKFGCLLGELDYGSEMYRVLSEAGMLPAQRLAKLAQSVLSRKITPEN